MVLYLAEGHLLAGEIALDEGRVADAKTAHQQAKARIEEMGYLLCQGELLLLEARLEKNPALLKKAHKQFISLGQLGLLERGMITANKMNISYPASHWHIIKKILAGLGQRVAFLFGKRD